MRTIPIELLKRFLALPEGQPWRLVVHTNGKGAWQTEVTLFEGLPIGRTLDVASLLDPSGADTMIMNVCIDNA